MTKIIKSLSLTLFSLVLIFALFPAAASASDDVSGFEPRLTAPSKSSSYYNRNLNAFSQTGYGMPNCTAYAYGRIYEITGEAPKISRGNAGAWWSINKNNGYYEYGQEPQLGAIAVWSGHVAVVEAIDGSTVTCSQSHWRSTYFDTVTFESGANHFGQRFYGYIYACKDYFDELEESKQSVSYKAEAPQYLTANDNKELVFANTSIVDSNEPSLIYNSAMLKNAIIK